MSLSGPYSCTAAVISRSALRCNSATVLVFSSAGRALRFGADHAMREQRISRRQGIRHRRSVLL
jgi:hypothetical protein